MPQFDFTFWPPQAFWAVVTFGLLCFIMARVIAPKVGGVLENREARINGALRKAERLKQDADEALAAYENAMASARSKAEELVREVREKAAAEAHARGEEISARLSEQIAAAEASIANARQSALGQVGEIATAIAGAAVERLIGQKVDARSVKSAVDQATGGTR